MIGEIVLSGARALLDIILDRRTGHKIEAELNTHLRGESRKFTNYNGDEVEVYVESITVRPKYFPEGPRRGIQQVEADEIFTKLEADRESSSFSERFNAILKNHWITVVTLQISTGELNDVRPHGINLGYASVIATRRLADGENSDISPIGWLTTPQVKGIETGDIHSDKLKLKLPYSGSIGEYTEYVSRGFDLIERSQNRFEEYGILQLIELHNHPEIEDPDSAWPNREQAEKLGRFVFGMPVDAEVLAEHIEDIKDQTSKNNRGVDREE